MSSKRNHKTRKPNNAADQAKKAALTSGAPSDMSGGNISGAVSPENVQAAVPAEAAAEASKAAQEATAEVISEGTVATAQSPDQGAEGSAPSNRRGFRKLHLRYNDGGGDSGSESISENYEEKYEDRYASYETAEHWELDPEPYREDEEELEAERSYNRSNVNRLKRLILIALLVMFLIPTVLCVILLFRMHSMQKEMDSLREETLSRKQAMMQAKAEGEDPVIKEQSAYASLEMDKNGNAVVLHQPQPETQEPTTALSEIPEFPDDVIVGPLPGMDTEEETTESTEDVTENPNLNGKKVYLTFDDGPSKNCGELLDILKEKNVKATFFMVLNDTSDEAVIKRMAAEGHTLGIHSASHVYSEIYADLNSFIKDVETVHDLLQEMTGQDVRLYRFPGGSSNRVADVDIFECIEYLNEEGYTYFDWNALNEDAEAVYTEPYTLNANVMRYVRNNSGDSVVLMHDLSGHHETLEALPQLIDMLVAEGYEIVPIDADTEPVQHRHVETEEEKAIREANEARAAQEEQE